MPQLELKSFFPFRLNRLANEISIRLSRVYTERFGIGISEWRIIATLGEYQSCTAKTIVSSTRTHKSRISRAVARLVANGYVQQCPDQHDNRERNLRLTRRGKALYESLAPLVLEREAALLACLEGAERQALYKALSKLENALGLEIDLDTEKKSLQ